MYWIEDENGLHPRANVPRVEITNLQEVFAMLDAGVDPCVAHAEFPNGERLDVEVPSNYALNSLGRKTTIVGGTILFMKRLQFDIEHLARYQWGRIHTWNEDTMGSWSEAVGITDTTKPVDEAAVGKLGQVFPNTSLLDIITRYRIQHYDPTLSVGTLIWLAMRKNHPLTDNRPSKSGIAIEFQDNEFGWMGIARDKRTGQTWMWPLGEEINVNEEFGMAPEDKADAFVAYRDSDGHKRTVGEMVDEINKANQELGYLPDWVGPTTRRLEYRLDSYKAHRLEKLDRRDIRRALHEELERGGLPDTFHYPCHTDKGTVWCDWVNEENRTEIMLKTKESEKQVAGWLNRVTGQDGLRWWWWETVDGAKGRRLPSYQQALLDFIDSTNLGLRRY
ncbi:hypothetical protein [Bifidobacterium ruminantium]|uniref:hypothetical protein n=1 Tax=Bifidobacterium ruminantium TaxID=78346 RepID=UPI002492E41B|nr:hypothetical protein [Bifidobacterium ruminantium]